MSTHPLHKYDYLVFIGRFQPFHWGHKVVVQQALEISDNVIILIGSSNRSRSTYNPWTFEERKNVIEQEFYGDKSRVLIYPLEDWMYNDAIWIKKVQEVVKESILDTFSGNSKHNTLHGYNDIKIGLIGCDKDHSSFYLKLFPQWDSIDVSNYNNLNSTIIRNSYFSGHSYWEDSQITPISTYRFLNEFKEFNTYNFLVEEQNFIKRYKSAWNGPYKPIFSTVDSVVIQSGHILLVKRKARPGKGQLALPGGFVQQSEKLEDAVIRELREETKIKVPDPVLRGSIVNIKVFDDPHRSTRGRTITHAYLFNLNNQTTLPKVKGGDDAEKAFWVPLANLTPEELFEDHYFIIQNMVGEL